jgi:hypothetical protein
MEPPADLCAIPRPRTSAPPMTRAAAPKPNPRDPFIGERLRWPRALGSGPPRAVAGWAEGRARARGRGAGFKEIRGAAHSACGPEPAIVRLYGGQTRRGSG